MTDQEINIAIAEACPTVAGVWSDGELRWNYKLRPVPTCFDPVNDLNAMHEAEKVLTQAQKEMFIHNLMGVCLGQAKAAYGTASTDTFTALWLATFATARQRAEAFLRTLGKWKE